MSEILLEGRDLTKIYPIKHNFITGRVTKTFTAVEKASLELRQGETLGIVGESGSGKTTTGEMLGDLQRPDSGTVLYRGRDIRSMTPEEYRVYRRNVQFIFQDPKGSMNAHQRIREILEEPLLTLDIEADPAKRTEKARKICEAVGLEPSSLEKYPGELSGGQCQRVAIARALITEPEIIVCDEAVSALDVSVQAQILNLLRDIQDERNVSYLFITHDIGVVNYMADRVVVFLNGRIVERGPAEEILTEPRTDYTKKLLAASFVKRD